MADCNLAFYRVFTGYLACTMPASRKTHSSMGISELPYMGLQPSYHSLIGGLVQFGFTVYWAVKGQTYVCRSDSSVMPISTVPHRPLINDAHDVVGYMIQSMMNAGGTAGDTSISRSLATLFTASTITTFSFAPSNSIVMDVGRPWIGWEAPLGVLPPRLLI